MSYNLTLQCGCLVYIACDPLTTVAHARIIERRDPGCRVRKHEVGLRLGSVGDRDGPRGDRAELRASAVPRAEATREVVTQAALGLRREAR